MSIIAGTICIPFKYQTISMGGQGLSFDSSLSLFGNKFAKASDSWTPHAEIFFLSEVLCLLKLENFLQN